MKSLSARYFDGQSSRPVPVTLRVQDGELQICDADGALLCACSVRRLKIAERMGTGPRLIHFVDGGLCEIADHSGLKVLMQDLGLNDGGVAVWQHRWRVVLAATLICICTAFSAYHWGLPAVAEVAVRYIPQEWAKKSDQQTLLFLDKAWLEPSKLTPARQKSLRAQFAQLKPPSLPVPAWELQFRAAPKVGANAFALPGGTLVMTDELVALASDDHELLAVLAHELGHAAHRHGLRSAVQGAILGAVVTAWLGDVSAAVAGFSTAVLEARYSREFERDADHYAADMLLANGLTPNYLATILQRMEMQRPHRDESDNMPALLSSHPATRERIEAMAQRRGPSK